MVVKDRTKSTTKRRAAASTHPADFWRDLGEKFKLLAAEDASADEALCAYCSYAEHVELPPPGESEIEGPYCPVTYEETAVGVHQAIKPDTGVWLYNGEASVSVREQFRTLAVRAGIGLGCAKPKRAEDFWRVEDFWLHQLYSDLQKRRSRHLAGMTPWKHDTLSCVVENSATFCARLERESLESSAAAEPTSQKATEARATRESKSGVVLPRTWEELRKRGSITQSETAGYLCCGTKTVQRIVKAKELKQSPKKRIICNQELRNQIRKVHGNHVLP